MKARSVACLVALLGAVGGASGANAAPAPAGHEVSYSTLEQGRWGLWNRPELVGAASDCEWAAQMDQIASQGGFIVATTPHAPAVDWSRQVVVLVALGLMDGWSVEVTHAWRNGRTLVLDVALTMGQGSGEMNVSPYQLVAVDAKSVDQVEARYNLAPPGLASQVALNGCGAAPVVHSPKSTLGALEMTGGAVSWGALKLRYR